MWEEIGLAGTWVQTASSIAAVAGRELLIQAVTMGAGRALSIASAAKLGAAGQAATKLGVVSRGIEKLGRAAAGAGQGAKALRAGLKVTNWGGRTYDAVNTVKDTYEGIQMVRAGNPLGWISIVGGALSGVGAAVGGYGRLRKLLGRGAEAAADSAKASQARGIVGQAVGCALKAGNCFAAGTKVATASDSEPIESLTVGRRVLTYAENEGGERRDQDIAWQVVPEHWRKVQLVVDEGGPKQVDVTLLRPESWLELHGVEEGGVVELYLAELGVKGPATVLSVEPCPTVEDGDDARTKPWA